MYVSPISLEDICVGYICDNLEALFGSTSQLQDKHEKGENSKEDKLFLGEETILPVGISDRLLEQLSERRKLHDREMTLFDAPSASLRNVRIRNAGKLTTKGLRILKGHKIHNLETTGLTVSVNDLIGCLGEWTLQNLRSLNVSGSTFVAGSKFCVVVCLSKLRNLHSLNVAGTEFNSHALDIVIEDLPLLENLNISSTQVADISPLRKCRDRIRSLSMYNLKVSHNENVIPVLLDLHQLQHLDISDEKDRHPFAWLEPDRFTVSALLKPDALVNLQSLDISGVDRVDEGALQEFVLSHPKLNFLGLMYLNACYDQMFVNPDFRHYRQSLVVTGLASEQQVMEGLQRYPHRPLYIQKCLFNLFRFTAFHRETRSDLIKLVVAAMKYNQQQFGIQMAATACLYNLTKGALAQKVHPSVLRKVVELCLDAMETFPNHFQLQKNTLLTLCSDHILHDIMFDKYRCAKLVLECLCSFNDSSVNRMSVAICSVLASKISTKHSSLLGAESKYMSKLLEMVRQRVGQKTVDITLKFTLSALWNLTDESPATCRMFLEEDGLKLYLEMLDVYANETLVETKVLGLLNNIAEVADLRSHLMCSDFIDTFRKLLHSEHIDVSYFSAGIIANLCSDGLDAWTIKTVPWKEILKDLGDVVTTWVQPSNEMVAYRSFEPFYPLLSCFDGYEVQLWALWAIQHVCSKNGKRYCIMLQEEKGDVRIRNVAESPLANSEVRALSIQILDMVRQEMAAESNMDMICQTIAKL